MMEDLKPAYDEFMSLQETIGPKLFGTFLAAAYEIVLGERDIPIIDPATLAFGSNSEEAQLAIRSYLTSVEELKLQFLRSNLKHFPVEKLGAVLAASKIDPEVIQILKESSKTVARKDISGRSPVSES